MSRRSKNPTLKGGTSPYSLCMGVHPRVCENQVLMETRADDRYDGGDVKVSHNAFLCHQNMA